MKMKIFYELLSYNIFQSATQLQHNTTQQKSTTTSELLQSENLYNNLAVS